MVGGAEPAVSRLNPRHTGVSPGEDLFGICMVWAWLAVAPSGKSRRPPSLLRRQGGLAPSAPILDATDLAESATRLRVYQQPLPLGIRGLLADLDGRRPALVLNTRLAGADRNVTAAHEPGALGAARGHSTQHRQPVRSPTPRMGGESVCGRTAAAGRTCAAGNPRASLLGGRYGGPG